MDEIYETGCHKMWQMADSRDGKIMLVIIKNERKRTDGQSNPADPLDLFRRGLFCRCYNIVGIFQKMVCGTLIAGLFRTGHRMSTDKNIFIA